MGIIKRQAISATFINLMGVSIGSVSRFLMPLVLSSSQIGVMSYITSVAHFFNMIFTLGFNLILKKVFPNFRNEENGHAGFLLFGLFLSLFGSLIGIVTFFGLEGLLLNKGKESSPLMSQFFYLVPYLIVFRILFVNLDGYVKMQYKTIAGTFLDGFVGKIVLLVAIVLYNYLIVDFEWFLYLYCGALGIPGLLITMYAFLITKKIKLPSRALLSEYPTLKTFVLFGILSGASGSVVQLIDTFMIYKMSAPSDAESLVGVYAIMFFAASLINIPSKNLRQIAAVVVSESWKKNDLANINKIYKESANTLLVVGSFLFLIGWVCLSPVLTFLDPEYQLGLYVFFFLGLARVVELGTGVNIDIIESSRIYKYNTYFNIVLAVLVILFNLVGIYYYGIVGAAIASFLAQTIINFLRGYFLYKEFKLWPFDMRFLKAIGLFFVLLASSFLLNYEANAFIKIGVNFLLFAIAYISLAYVLKLSEPLNKVIERFTFLGKK